MVDKQRIMSIAGEKDKFEVKSRSYFLSVQGDRQSLIGAMGRQLTL